MRGARWPVTWGVGAVIVVVGAAVLIALKVMSGSLYQAEAERQRAKEEAEEATIAAAARPILAALQAYRRDYGAFPVESKNLIPKYLPAWPKTGVRSFPYFDYVTWSHQSDPFPFWLYAYSATEDPQFDYKPCLPQIPPASAALPSERGDWEWHTFDD